MPDDIKWFMREFMQDLHFFASQVREDYRSLKRFRRTRLEYKKGIR